MTLQIGSDSIVIEQRIVYIEEKDDVLQELDHSNLAKLAAPISGAKGLSATLTRMPFRNPIYRPLLVNPSLKLPSFNLALHVLAYGGVYFGGGIAPKIVTKLKDGSFMEGFTSKGRYMGFLKGIRVSVALNPLAPLIGAANFAKLL